jgi:hypothetical protein
MATMTAPHVEAASTLAVIASSNEPLLFLRENLTVIAASASFCRVFQIDPASVPGRRLSDLGAADRAVPQLGSLLKATASGSAQIEPTRSTSSRRAMRLDPSRSMRASSKTDRRTIFLARRRFCCKRCGIGSPNARGVFAESDITRVVGFVLDPPVLADGVRCQVCVDGAAGYRRRFPTKVSRGRWRAAERWLSARP